MRKIFQKRKKTGSQATEEQRNEPYDELTSYNDDETIIVDEIASPMDHNDKSAQRKKSRQLKSENGWGLTFSELSEDIGFILTLVEFLDLDTTMNLSLTCRQFAENCFQKKLSLSFKESSRLVICHLPFLLRSCRNIQSIDFSALSGRLRADIIAMIHPTHLHTLILDYCMRLQVHSLIKLLSQCSNLKHLSLRNCTWGVNDQVIDCIGLNCPKLEFLNISGCSQVTNAVFKSPNRGLSNLVQNYDALSRIIVTVTYGIRNSKLTRDGVSQLYNFCHRRQREHLKIDFRSEAL